MVLHDVYCLTRNAFDHAWIFFNKKGTRPSPSLPWLWRNTHLDVDQVSSGFSVHQKIKVLSLNDFSTSNLYKFEKSVFHIKLHIWYFVHGQDVNITVSTRDASGVTMTSTRPRDVTWDYLAFHSRRGDVIL